MPTFSSQDLRNFEIAFRNPVIGAKLKAALDALEADNTDCQIPIDPWAGISDDNTVTWTRGITSAGVRTNARAAAATAASLWFGVPMATRTTAQKGRMPTGVKVAYQVATATVSDVRFELWRRTIPADATAPSAPELIAGATNSEYNSPCDTAAKRSASATGSGHHTAIVTIPTAAQTFAGDGVQYLLRVYVDGTAGATGVVTLKDLALLASENLVDLTT